ncbi:hypothetical protein ACLOJK_004017, partial [Asimina triloba]
QFKEQEANLEATSTMDGNNYQWGYQSIYEEDVISVATAQLAAWKERLEMNGSENEPSLEDLMVQYIQAQTVSLKNLETLMGQMTNTLAQLCRQPESFPNNTESNPRQNDIAQCPSVTLRIEVQLEPETQVADKLVSSSSSSPNPSSSKPTPPSPVKQCIPPPPFKQASFNEEKASQVKRHHRGRKMRECRKTQPWPH